MSKRQSAKYKIDRRMGENIWGRPKSPVNQRQYGPGQRHGRHDQCDAGQLRGATRFRRRRLHFFALAQAGETRESIFGYYIRRSGNVATVELCRD